MMSAFLVVFLAMVSVNCADHRLVGAYSDANMNAEGVDKALQFAVQQFNQRNNDLYMWRVRKLVSAQTQVVAGTNYKLKVELARTKCKQGTAQEDLQVCELHDDPDMAKTHACTFTVFSQVWTNTIKLTESNCEAIISNSTN
ncbi:cystatin [Latimeria chalumnae]|uniref:Cystatin domain-containing protein n=1 Tax=Latimeria chalumnae TaxID=7897 RepID=H3AGN6_LATCH|nr:PREDICTED: cystatin-like [Latimeria chalumnae]|eukprot:XP_005995959.1 PREDICTED: cystatin-like [Latimeria chalumnae]